MSKVAQHVEQSEGLVPWTAAEASAYGQRPLVAKHRLQELDLFSDSALTDLLHSYPRDRLQAFTMGTDPEKRTDWQPVDTAGATGQDLLQAVSRGRLWYNVQQVQSVDRRYRDLLDGLYAGLSGRCAGFRPHRMSCTLIISSPTSQTYYHADAQPNLLWQLRGVKRVWAYPAGDRRLIDQELMEDIFANFADEEVPFESSWDRLAESHELHAGEVMSWPQNAPHRVVNLQGLNISLSTIHETEESDRRKLVYCANRLFHRTYRLPVRSTREFGVGSYLKRLSYRLLRRGGLVHTPSRRVYLSGLRIDPRSAVGYVPLPGGPVLTEYSQKEFRMERDAAGKMSVVRRSAA